MVTSTICSVFHHSKSMDLSCHAVWKTGKSQGIWKLTRKVREFQNWLKNQVFYTNGRIKFPDFWSIFKILDFSGFQVAWQPWSVDLPLWNTEYIMAITPKHNRSWKFYAIGNHIFLFSTFLATFLITTFFKKIPVEKFVFSVVRRKLNIFAIFHSDYG